MKIIPINQVVNIAYCFKRYLIGLLFLIGPLHVSAQDVSLFEQFNGQYDFTAIGNTLNTGPNDCDILTQSSANLTLTGNQDLVAARLYWSGSGGDLLFPADNNVTLNGTDLSAERTFTENSVGLTFFGAYADVTDIVAANGNGTYTLSNLDLTNNIYNPPGPNNASQYCNQTVDYGGWSIIVIYEEDGLALNQISLFDGLEVVYQNELITILDNIYIASDELAKIGFLAWEGDLPNPNNESLRINNILVDDPPLNPGDNQFNSTNTYTNSTNLYNMDLDVYDIEGLVDSGDTSIEIKMTSDSDLVLINNIIVLTNTELLEDIDNDGDGFTIAQGDCNDNDATIYPGADEICDDGIDQDCNGSDLSCDDIDNDGDGYTEAQGDCNDNDATIYPGAEEICDNGIDNNCDGIIPVIGDLILESAIGTDSQNICSGDSIDEIIYFFSAEYTGVISTGLPLGVSLNVASGIATISGTPTDDISTQTIYNYTVTTLGGGDCVDTSISGTLMVNPNPFLLLTSEGGTDSQVLCNGDQLEFIEYYLISGDDINFDTTQVTGLPEGITFVINGGLFIQGTPSVDINVTTSYTYTISNYWFGECPGNDVIGTITIQPCDDIDNDGDSFTENQGDCNDNDSTIYPGAEEICDDGIDQDCDGSDCEAEPCEISNPSNNFETGIQTSLGFIGANDFIISNNFTLMQINLNLFHTPATTISTVAITYYEDAGGVPGALIGSETLAPASQVVVGSNFGFPVSEVILDVSPVNFTEGTYWIGVTADSSTGELTAWETTSASSIGAESAISGDGGNSWGAGRADGVFTLIGTCND
jgi:hypothetical protein